MRLQSKILIILGVICSIIGVIAKLLSLESVNGDYLLILGLFSVLLANTFSLTENIQSKQQKILNWVSLFVIIVGGITFYLKIW